MTVSRSYYAEKAGKALAALSLSREKFPVV